MLQWVLEIKLSFSWVFGVISDRKCEEVQETVQKAFEGLCINDVKILRILSKLL